MDPLSLEHDDLAGIGYPLRGQPEKISTSWKTGRLQEDAMVTRRNELRRQNAADEATARIVQSERNG
jgi:hypothetical protein